MHKRLLWGPLVIGLLGVMALLAIAVKLLEFSTPETADIVTLRDPILTGPYPLEATDLIVRRENPKAEEGSRPSEGFHLVVSGRLRFREQKPEVAAGEIARMCYRELDASRGRKMGGESSVDISRLVRIEVTIRGTDATSKPAVVCLTREEYQKALKGPAPPPPSKPPGVPPPKNPPTKTKNP